MAVRFYTRAGSVRAPAPPHPRTLSRASLFNFSHFSRCLVVSHCGFINAFPLITFNIKHLFMPLFAICMSSLVKRLHIFYSFLWGCLFLLIYLSFIVLIQVFYQVYDLQIFPLGLWLVMSAMAFEEQFPF